ncbi:MAG: ATP-binding cassette domain-containing protein [Chloroflexota bacterium]|nr:ATP-binding cassette domain-containing protein [Chloroflexota bacterium]
MMPERPDIAMPLADDDLSMGASLPSSALHPLTWFVWSLACTLVVATTRNPLYVLLVMLCAGATFRAARSVQPTAGAQWSLVLRAAWTLTTIAILFNTLTVHAGDRALFRLPRDLPLVGAVIGGPVTLNALLYGIISALALGTLILTFAALNAAVGYEELLRLLPRPLTGLGVTMTVALGFLPQTITALGEVREAQAVRGHAPGRGLRGGPFGSMPPLVVPVLALGLERAIALAEAMAARGFGVPQAGGGRIRRTAYRAHPWRMLDSAVTAGAVITAVAVAATALGGSALIYYPYPRLLWPPFAPLVGLALLPLLLPALMLPYAREFLPPAPPSEGGAHGESEAGSPSLGGRGSGDRNPLACLARVTYAYPHTATPILDAVCWDMLDKETTLLLGPSGAGKSTLLRTFNGLVPHFTGGRFGGATIVAGHVAHCEGPRGMSAVVGMLFQDPETAAVAPRVADDIAFALEQHGIPRAEMRWRVRRALDAVGMAHLAEREIATLSGGERQRVALAAAIVRAPRLLILDEPTSQLDPDGARAVLDAVAAVQTASGMAVMLAEHRLDRVIARATSGLFLPGDGSLANGTVRDTLTRAGEQSATWAPPIIVLGQALGWHPLPLSVADAMPFAVRDGLMALDSPPISTAHPAGAPLLTASGLSVTLGGQPVLCDVDLALYAGEVVAVVGVNGAGKTTLLRALLGLRVPDAGRISVMGREVTAGVAARGGQIGYVPQQPGTLLFAETVVDELAFTLRAHDRQAFPTRYGDADGLLAALRLDGMAHRYPRDLSVGERARVAIAATLAADPPLLFLDEPTRGLDPDAKESLIAILRQLRDEGRAVLLVTHDAELVARAADRVILLDRGRIVAAGHPRAVLPGSPFAPQINRLLGGAFLTVADVLAARPAHERAAVEA